MMTLLIIFIVMIGFWLRLIGNWTVLILVHWSMSSLQKCKPIYDRWVHRHGNDPDKWPAPAELE